MSVKSNGAKWASVSEAEGVLTVDLPCDAFAVLDFVCSELVEFSTCTHPITLKLVVDVDDTKTEAQDDREMGLRLEALAQEQKAVKASIQIRSAIEDILLEAADGLSSSLWSRERAASMHLERSPSPHPSATTELKYDDNQEQRQQRDPQHLYNILVWFEGMSYLASALVKSSILDGRYAYQSVLRDEDICGNTGGVIVRFWSLSDARIAVSEIDGASLHGKTLCAEPLFSVEENGAEMHSGEEVLRDRVVNQATTSLEEDKSWENAKSLSPVTDWAVSEWALD